MFDWKAIGTKTEMKFILDCIMKKIDGKRIIKIFEPYGLYLDSNKKYISTDEKIYVIFDDNTCLIVDMKNIGSACISYVSTNDIDVENYHLINDMFKTENEELEYGSIIKFEVNGFNHEFDKWISNGNTSSMIRMPAGGDYFDKITMILDSGKKVCIKSEDAIMDGYCDIWMEN